MYDQHCLLRCFGCYGASIYHQVVYVEIFYFATDHPPVFWEDRKSKVLYLLHLCVNECFWNNFSYHHLRLNLEISILYAFILHLLFMKIFLLCSLDHLGCLFSLLVMMSMDPACKYCSCLICYKIITLPHVTMALN